MVHITQLAVVVLITLAMATGQPLAAPAPDVAASQPALPPIVFAPAPDVAGSLDFGTALCKLATGQIVAAYVSDVPSHYQDWQDAVDIYQAGIDNPMVPNAPSASPSAAVASAGRRRLQQYSTAPNIYFGGAPALSPTGYVFDYEDYDDLVGCCPIYVASANDTLDSIANAFNVPGGSGWIIDYNPTLSGTVTVPPGTPLGVPCPAVYSVLEPSFNAIQCGFPQAIFQASY